MADGVWKAVYPKILGHSRQLLLDKILDPSTPTVRKVHNGEGKKVKEKKKNTSLAAQGALAYRLL